MKSQKNKLIKVSSEGYCGLRKFSLSTDNKRLVWDTYRNDEISSIAIEEIDEIVYGQTTQFFQMRHLPRELACLSFSLLVGTACLNLVAPSPMEYEVWTEGLAQLSRRITAQRQGVDIQVQALKELVIEVPLLPASDDKDLLSAVDFYLRENKFETS